MMTVNQLFEMMRSGTIPLKPGNYFLLPNPSGVTGNYYLFKLVTGADATGTPDARFCVRLDSNATNGKAWIDKAGTWTVISSA